MFASAPLAQPFTIPSLTLGTLNLHSGTGVTGTTLLIGTAAAPILGYESSASSV